MYKSFEQEWKIFEIANLPEYAQILHPQFHYQKNVGVTL